MIVSFINLKGGTAKTTSTIYLATCAYYDDRKPLVLDADPEKSALAWAALGNLPFEVRQADLDGLVIQSKDLAEEGYTVFIDGPPNLRDVLWSAATVSDIVVVPMNPSGVEINRLRSTLKLLLNIEQTRPDGLNTKILFTQYDKRTVLAREIVDTLKDFPIMNSTIRFLQRYRQEFGVEPKYLVEYQKAWWELTDELEE